MTAIKQTLLSLVLTGMVLAPITAAADVTHSTPAIGGYDVVSYQLGEKPVRGNGNHIAVHEGVTYVFQNEKNRKAFEKEPARYVPAYGGYCAFGVSVGKKFVGDPDVWEIVDGRLYLNLDNKIKGMWVKDIPGNIKKAEKQWPKIRNAAAADL